MDRYFYQEVDLDLKSDMILQGFQGGGVCISLWGFGIDLER